MTETRLLAALLIALLGSGCAGSTPAGEVASPLEGTAWRLVAFGEAAASQPAPADARITVEFAGGRFGGNAGCNRYTGSYAVRGDTLSLALGGVTRRACPPPIMERERAYLEALRAVRGWASEGDRLQLGDDAGEALLHFERAQEAVPGEAQPAGEDQAEGVDFRGLGQEPGWTLEIREGQRITFVYDYGEHEAVVPAPAPIVSGGQTVYRAETEAHDLTVTILDEPCTDVMSGQRFEATVTVELDGKTYRGCGRAER